MITAVDTSVILDLLTNQGARADAAESALRKATLAGAVLVCTVVWAEVRAYFSSDESLAAALEGAGVRHDPLDCDCANMAGRLWGAYRRAGGARTRIVSDFLIGAHAMVRGGRLLSRDHGFYRRYFSGLEVLP